MRALVIAATVCACGGKPEPRASTTTLVVHVTDQGKAVAARVMLVDATGAPVHIGTLDVYRTRQGGGACAIAPGVIGSWDGLVLGYGVAEVPVGVDACTPSPAIPYGHYKVVAWRGIEYDRWEGEVDLSADRGRVELTIPLHRAWTPHGTMAADLHVHAFASDDSKMPNQQRVIAQASMGIAVIGLSDHNTAGDLAAEIHELRLDDVVTSISSDELTSDTLHLGVYPVPRGSGPPASKIWHANVDQVFQIAHSFPGNPIVQVNHPRFRVTALYDQAGWDGVSWPPPFPLAFDAVEVLAGYTAFNIPSDRRFDDSVRDYYTLVDHGHLVTPMGNSDTHDFTWVLDGTARNYVYVDDARTNPFDEAGFIAAIRARRVVATTGPWLDVEIAPKRGATPTAGPGQFVTADAGGVWVDLRVERAAVVKLDRIRITIGGEHGPELAQTIDVPPDVPSFGWHGRIEVGHTDTWIGVTTDGDTPLPLEQTGWYQREKWKHPGVTPFAIASPILVDADGNGRWKRGDADIAVPKR